MDTFIHYGMAAGIEAIKDAGFEANPANAERIGVNIGSGIGGLPLIEDTHLEYQKSGPRKISPFFVPGSIINMISGNLSIMYGLKGPNLAIVTACTTATHCIGESGRIIQYGDADVMIAGGAESTVSPLGVGGFYIIPRKRRLAKAQFAERVAELRAQLHESLQRQAHHEIAASAERINETIAPYRRFVQTQRDRLEESRSALVTTEDALLRLKSEIERA